jgi:hypothetical protein
VGQLKDIRTEALEISGPEFPAFETEKPRKGGQLTRAERESMHPTYNIAQHCTNWYGIIELSML